MVARDDIVWADLGRQWGRRPVCVVTRDTAIALLDRVTCAPITRTIREIPSEVPVGISHGLPGDAVINCDNLVTIGKHRLDQQPIGRLDLLSRQRLDRALRFSLDIIF